jgi:multiple sugar transport system substrate-binding protein
MKARRDASAARGRLSRREFVKATGVAAAGAAGVSLGLFGGKAPAFAQAREMHVLEWSSFVKEADVEVNRQAEEFSKAEGITVKVEHINNNDLNARTTAAVESGSGPDVVQLFNNQPLLYASGLLGVNDLVEATGGKRIYGFFRESVDNDGTYVGVPYFATGAAYVYNKDMYKEAGAKPSETWDEFLDSGRKLKKAGYPVGQALGHSFGDPPGFCYSLFWGFGGKLIDEKAHVAIDTKETRAALNFVKEFWKAACDESGLGWDDTANNRAFAAETISVTRNGASIYFVAKRNLLQKGDPFAKKLDHFLDPKGPAGRRHSMTAYSRCIFKASKVQSAAKNYVRFCLQKDNLGKLIEVNNGYINGPTPDWETIPMWKEDPALRTFAHAPSTSVTYGWPGPNDRRASEAVAKYILVDMFARAVQGESADSATRWAAGELKQIYG